MESCLAMYSARLVCSGCCSETVAETATLGELDALACDCGCSFEVIGWPDVAAEPLAQVILLRAFSRRIERVAA